MITRRLIEISAPRDANALTIPLRLVTRAGHPPMLIPPLEWCFDLFWLHGITVESPAPLPARRFDHVAKILAQPALGESWTTRRN
jgi:hypothetical protein